MSQECQIRVSQVATSSNQHYSTLIPSTFNIKQVISNSTTLGPSSSCLVQSMSRHLALHATFSKKCRKLSKVYKLREQQPRMVLENNLLPSAVCHHQVHLPLDQPLWRPNSSATEARFKSLLSTISWCTSLFEAAKSVLLLLFFFEKKLLALLFMSLSLLVRS
jgi:hypothetical protein